MVDAELNSWLDVDTAFEADRIPVDEQVYQARIETVLNTPLSPENINTYTQDALEALITVTGEVAQMYDAAPVIRTDLQREHETAAFAYFGLTPIDATLDHIAGVADHLRDLDDIVARIPTIQTVITPPDEGRIRVGGGDFALDHSRIPRLKTILFILENEFDIDIQTILDEDRIVEGIVTPDMVRKTPYAAIDATEINKFILVCD
jgi:hypothetical protein